jgi:hypothetical protein
MANATVPKSALAIGAGVLYSANANTAYPANTVVGSVFTDLWATAGAWLPIGITKNGHELTYAPKVDAIEAEEYLDPIAYTTTGRTSGVKFELMQVNMTNWKRMVNGGSGALTTSGSGTTLLTTGVLPGPGQEVRCMLGWEADTNDERWVAEQCLQSGTLSVKRQKGASVATFTAEFNFELGPVSGRPFTPYGAGTLRG